jgi:hypothetical protein
MSPAVGLSEHAGAAPVPEMTALDPEMIEVALLLPRWQAVALQAAARQRGLSAAQMLRRMIGAAVGCPQPAA